MYCNTCKKEISNPIVRNDGRLFCDECLTRISPEKKLEINNLNQSLYLESELFYNDYFIRQKKKNYLERALNLARQSAYLKNPYAIIAIGYYYERRIIITNSEYERVYNALLWYDIVASYNDRYNQEVTNLPIKDVSLKERTDMKKLADQAIINIYSLLKSSQLVEELPLLKHDVPTTLQKLISLFENISIDKSSLSREASYSMPSFHLFLQDINKENRIFFGYQKVTYSVINQIISDKFSLKKERDIFFSDYDVHISTNRTNEWHHVQNVNTLKAKVEQLTKNVIEDKDSNQLNLVEFFFAFCLKGRRKINYKLKNKYYSMVFSEGNFEGNNLKKVKSENIQANFYYNDIILLDNIRRKNDIIGDTVFDCVFNKKV